MVGGDNIKRAYLLAEQLDLNISQSGVQRYRLQRECVSVAAADCGIRVAVTGITMVSNYCIPFIATAGVRRTSYRALTGCGDFGT